MPIPTGTQLGPYEILAPIGAGGMGEVYRAHDSRLERQVAVKVLPEHLSQNPQALARFVRETKALAALSHPNLLAIFDTGIESGISYAVTELLEGESLRASLLRSPLPWRNASEIGAALAEGLAAAHSKGITHRDLKPENIFLTVDGRVKILDFGLARVEAVQKGADADTQTQDGTVLGTPAYMSPEQVRGTPADPASDIFSLGCVLYEMIAGRRAFPGKTAAETMSSILRDTPRELSVSGAQVPAELDRLIFNCMQKNCEVRFQSARDLAFHCKAILNAPSSASQPSRAIDSIAVLPFANASSDPDTEYLCDGITESILNSLSQIAQLHVTPRSTVFRYKARDADPQMIGRELNVRLVLTGRIVQRGDNLVASAELVDVAAGSQLWGERYHRKLSDIFALEEEIARKICESLRLKLIEELQMAVDLCHRSVVVGALGHAYAVSGNRAEGLRILEEVLDRAKRETIDLIGVTVIYAGLGDTENALTSLEKACEARGMSGIGVKVDTRYDALRSEPRFQQVLKRMNLA